MQFLCKLHAHCPATLVPESKTMINTALKRNLYAERNHTYARGRVCQFAPALCKRQLSYLEIEKGFFFSSSSSKSCCKTKCITDMFIAFSSSISSLVLVVTNAHWRPRGSALPCLWEMVFGEDLNQHFGRKKPQTLGNMECILAGSRFHLTLGELELLPSRMLTVAGKRTDDVP